jgi:phage tail-like protein
MDANNTKYHLLHGERDWIPLLSRQASREVWWDRERQSLSLAPVVDQLSELQHAQLLDTAGRRGAAFDHYGNIYWINKQRDGIEYQAAATPLMHGNFWQVSDLCQNPLQNDQQRGDFTPVMSEAPACKPILSGLCVTAHEYLVVGTLQPAGLLVFDLHGGGPPEWLRWPQALAFSPYDFSCTPDGGMWILDLNQVSGAARVWRLDPNFRVSNFTGDMVPFNTLMSNDFHAEDAEPATTTVESEFPAGIELNADSPSLLNDALAIEALSDEAFLILSTSADGGPSLIHYFRHNQLLDSVGLDEEAIGGLLALAEISAHDFAFVADANQSSQRVSGRLYVSALTATQSFEFALRAGDSELELAMQPRLLPMREYSGRALITSANTAYYDFEQRWLPLTEQPRPRFQSEGEVSAIIMDGDEPDCVWHRIIMDASIPAGTRIVVESRAANEQRLLQELSWQQEPDPCLRQEGSELPLHDPFADIQSKNDRIGSWDLLLQNAVGRFIELRLTLQGTCRTTPRLRSLRLYYPRYSYLQRYLPAVYREDAISASFLDRFLANIEGLFTGLEDKITQAQLLFDTRTTPAEFLEWLGAWMGAFVDPSWDEARKRLFIDHAVLLFRWRGTPLGLWTIIKLSISECPDASLFDSLHKLSPLSEIALGGRDVRIVENFLTRGFPGIYLSDAGQSAALEFAGNTIPWQPAAGAGVLHQDFQVYLKSIYQGADGIAALNVAWNKAYSRFDQIQFPPLTPEQENAKRDWMIFVRDYLGFSYSQVSSEHLAFYQEFLARRYRQIARLNKAHGLLGEFMLSDFSAVTMPDELPRNTTALTDWIEFVSMVLPIQEQAHRFTVLLPTVLGEQPSAMARRKAQVEQIVQREKPAHTDFEVKFFWALFQIGSARLGIDTSIGDGSRFVAMVLGTNFLGQSYLAESHPWSVVDRSVLGRERLGHYQ